MQVSTMTPAQRDRAIEQLQVAIRVVQAAPVVTPCGECMYFDSFNGGGMCERWKAVVPVEHRAAGCASWAEGVPF